MPSRPPKIIYVSKLPEGKLAGTKCYIGVSYECECEDGWYYPRFTIEFHCDIYIYPEDHPIWDIQEEGTTYDFALYDYEQGHVEWGEDQVKGRISPILEDEEKNTRSFFKFKCKERALASKEKVMAMWPGIWRECPDELGGEE